jgi:hypothetical protein
MSFTWERGTLQVEDPDGFPGLLQEPVKYRVHSRYLKNSVIGHNSQ